MIATEQTDQSEMCRRVEKFLRQHGVSLDDIESAKCELMEIFLEMHIASLERVLGRLESGK